MAAVHARLDDLDGHLALNGRYTVRLHAAEFCGGLLGMKCPATDPAAAVLSGVPSSAVSTISSGPSALLRKSRRSSVPPH